MKYVFITKDMRVAFSGSDGKVRVAHISKISNLDSLLYTNRTFGNAQVLCDQYPGKSLDFGKMEINRSLNIESCTIESLFKDNLYAIKCPHGYLRISINNKIDASAGAINEWEIFSFMSLPELKDLWWISRHNWVEKGKNYIHNSQEIKINYEFITIKNYNINHKNQDMFIVKRNKHNNVVSFISISHDAVINEFVLYNPLVNMVVFGSGYILDQMQMCYNSLIDYGKFVGKTNIFTDQKHDLIMEYIGEKFFGNVKIYETVGYDRLDIMCARMLFAYTENIEDYQPVFYIDSDVIVDNDINEIGKCCLISGKISAQVEYLDTISNSPTTGSDLFARDPSHELFKDTYGFNAGIICIPNMEDFAQYIKSSMTLAKLVAGREGREGIRGFDQSIFNYVFAKLDIFDGTIITKSVRLPSGNDFPSPDKTERKGFVHFWPSGDRRNETMIAYSKALKNILV